MKRRTCCVGEMKARREKPCNDSEKVWCLTLASALPTCSRWRCLQRGRDTASKPSATYARQQSWQQRLGCQQNSGRSRRRWERCVRQGTSLHKRTRRGRSLRGSSVAWQRASRMRRCVRAFWLGHRFTPCCSKPKARPPRFRKTRRSPAGVEAPGAAGSSRGLSTPLSSSLQERASPPAQVSHSPAFQATAHDAAHDAFMTLPPYNSTREDEARHLGRGPQSCRV